MGMSELVQNIGRKSAAIGLASGALMGVGIYAYMDAVTHTEEERAVIISSCAQGIASLAGAENIAVDSKVLPEACEDGLVVNDFGYTVISTYKPVNLGEPKLDEKVKTYSLPSAQAFVSQKSTEQVNPWNSQVSIATAAIAGIVLGVSVSILSKQFIATNVQVKQLRAKNPINYPPKKK